jgi:broad specificity phosphatase PhoE
MKLYIIRHGETPYNKKHLLQGHHNIKLNKKGTRQAKALAKRLKVINFDYIYSSDLTRVRETTEEIMKYQNCPVKYCKSLRERNLGKFSGRPVDEFYKYLKEENFLGNIHHRLPGGGESYYAVYKRISKFAEIIYNKHKNQTILLSIHGGPKKVLMMYLKNFELENFLNFPQRFSNTSLSIVQFHKSGKHKIELENCIKHLEV